MHHLCKDLQWNGYPFTTQLKVGGTATYYTGDLNPEVVRLKKSSIHVASKSGNAKLLKIRWDVKIITECPERKHMGINRLYMVIGGVGQRCLSPAKKIRAVQKGYKKLPRTLQPKL